MWDKSLLMRESEMVQAYFLNILRQVRFGKGGGRIWATDGGYGPILRTFAGEFSLRTAIRHYIVENFRLGSAPAVRAAALKFS